MKLGELLALCRELKGFSLREVEAQTGITNAFICQIETGKSMPSFEKAVILCDFYGLSLEKLASTVRAPVSAKEG